MIFCIAYLRKYTINIKQEKGGYKFLPIFKPCNSARNLRSMRLKYLYLILLSAVCCFAKSQTPYEFKLNLTNQGCGGGSPQLFIHPPHLPSDSLIINWSTGEKNSRTVFNLTEGSYWVEVAVKHFKD